MVVALQKGLPNFLRSRLENLMNNEKFPHKILFLSWRRRKYAIPNKNSPGPDPENLIIIGLIIISRISGYFGWGLILQLNNIIH